MNPIDFPDSNLNLTKPRDMTDDECKSMMVFCTPEVMVSCWRLTWMDRLRVLFGRHVWLTVVGKRHPPVAMSTLCPIVRE